MAKIKYHVIDVLNCANFQVRSADIETTTQSSDPELVRHSHSVFSYSVIENKYELDFSRPNMNKKALHERVRRGKD